MEQGKYDMGKPMSDMSPDDVYAGRQEEVLSRRAALKRLMLERRKQYNLVRQDKVQVSDA